MSKRNTWTNYLGTPMYDRGLVHKGNGGPMDEQNV